MSELPLDPALDAVVQHAVEDARRRRQGEVTVEHLLWALLASPRGAAVIIGAGGDLDGLRPVVERALGPSQYPDERFGRVFARAVQHAASAGRTEITVDGVLAAIYREDVGALLIDHRIPRLAVLDFICHGITAIPRDAATMPRAWWRPKAAVPAPDAANLTSAGLARAPGHAP